MVLQGQPCGRVGRCRGFEGSIERSGPLLFFGDIAHEPESTPPGLVLVSELERDDKVRQSKGTVTKCSPYVS